MIESSFCFLPRVGVLTERRFWCEGLSTWERFLTTPVVRGIAAGRKARFDHEIAQAREHFLRNDPRYFSRAFLRDITGDCTNGYVREPSISISKRTPLARSPSSACLDRACTHR